MNKNIEILEIPFTSLSEEEILVLLRKHLHTPSSGPLFLATPNPEMLLECGKNLLFKKVIQSADLNLPDGNGLIWANRFLSEMSKINNKLFILLYGAFSLPAFLFHRKKSGQRFQKTIHGSDLTLKICLDPEICEQGIFLLGNKDGLRSNTAELAAKKLMEINPNIKISGYLDSTAADSTIPEKINHSGAKILLVAFGAPNQELWIAEKLPSLVNVKIAMGIGGTFDFIAGILPRAPEFMRKTGLEWLYRLIKQPKRIGRIINATLVFPYTVIKKRLSSPAPANPDKHKI